MEFTPTSDYTAQLAPFRLLPWCVCVCMEGVGFQSVSIRILAWQPVIHMITNTLPFWLFSPPICTQIQSNERQPWSQLIKEANPQTLNELSPPSPLKMCKMHRVHINKSTTARHNPPLVQLESNLSTCIRICNGGGWGRPDPTPSPTLGYVSFFFF